VAAVFTAGFDIYGPANSNASAVAAMLTAGEWTSAAGTAQQIVAPLSASGQALVIGAGGSLTKTIPTTGRIIGGLRFSSSLANFAGVQFLDGASNQAGIVINSTGTIQLRNGVYFSGTSIAVSAASITANSTHYLEWDISFGNAAAYQVWLDGVSLFSGTGDTTATANNTISGFSLICSSAVVYTVDDLYVFDASGTANNAVLLTSPRIETTFPISDSAVQFAAGAAILGSAAQRTATTNAPVANSLLLRRFTPAVSGTLNSITVMPGATSAPALFRPVVYADSGGSPGTLMSTGATQTGVTSGTAKDLPLTTPQPLTAGTQYWLGYMTDTSVAMQQSDAANGGYRAAATFGSGAPGTAPAMTAGQPTWLFWGNLSGTAVNYYEAAQQPPPGPYSYVFDATVGHEDLYGMSPLSASPGAVHTVAVKGYVQKSDSGTKTLSLRVKSGANDSGGSATGLAPGTSFGWLASYFATDPNTSAAWTGANLDAATAGIRVDS